MTPDDDQTWLDALAGREHGGGSPSTRAEGKILRDALRATQAARDPTEASAPPRDSVREEALIARAVREGVIGPGVADREGVIGPGAAVRSAGAPASRRHVRNWRPLLAAAVLACLATGLAWELHSPSGVAVVRSPGQEVVRLDARDPEQLKRDILSELRAAGVDAKGYESLGVQGVDADLPKPLPDSVRRVLASHAIPEPRDGVLRIEIREMR